MPRDSRQSRSRSPATPGARQSPYARTTITIPGELKARMEEVGSRVNWSAVASQAFEFRLSELEQKEPRVPEMPNKDDALERLRRLKNEPESQDRRKSGLAYLFGRHWAMADAHPSELERLEEFCRRNEINRPVEQWKIEFHDRQAVNRLFRELTLSILGCDRLGDVNRAGARITPFWEQRVGVMMDPAQRPRELSGPEFLSGFTQGALDFWEEVKDQL